MSSLPDFDTLVEMAKNNPEQLEQLRMAEVDRLIDKASTESQRRLRGLQFQIDAKRRLHKDSPMGACMAISEMMHDSFAEMCVWLNIMTGKDKAANHQISDDAKPAKVLSFSRA